MSTRESTNYKITRLRVDEMLDETSPPLVVSGVQDSAIYKSGDVNPTAGSGGGPAVWDGSSWIDL